MVDDLRNGQLTEAHGTRLKFYSNTSLDTSAIMSHVLSSETGMAISRLLRLEDNEDGIYVVIRWKGLSASGDTSEPLAQVYADVPDLLQKLFARHGTPQALANKARAVLCLKKGGL